MATYDNWKDRGGNIGLQCTVCRRTHWSGFEPATDPLTGLPCTNCADIKHSGVLKSENASPTRTPKVSQPAQDTNNAKFHAEMARETQDDRSIIL